ncbi:hypothetical protein ABKN59_010957 [Abortiporus biennis]
MAISSVSELKATTALAAELDVPIQTPFHVLNSRKKNLALFQLSQPGHKPLKDLQANHGKTRRINQSVFFFFFSLQINLELTTNEGPCF